MPPLPTSRPAEPEVQLLRKDGFLDRPQALVPGADLDSGKAFARQSVKGYLLQAGVEDEHRISIPIHLFHLLNRHHLERALVEWDANCVTPEGYVTFFLAVELSGPILELV